MGAWSQLARQLFASAGHRILINPNPISSRSRGSLQHLRSLSGLWDRPAREDSSKLTPATRGWQKQSIFSILAISAMLYCGGTQLVAAEEVCHSSPPKSAAAASSLNKVSNAQLQGQGMREADGAEAASNVHTAKWRVFTDMGREHFSKGRLDESEKYLVQALEEAKQGFGEKDAHVASSCNNLAELYRMKRDFGKAEPLFLEALAILEKAFNPNHVSVSFTLHNLGGTYLVQRKFDEARQCYERSLEIKEKALGRNHPEFANTLFHLGEVLRLQGQFTEAQKRIQESIDVLQEDASGLSQVTIRRMGRLVEILSQTGQLKEAEKLQRKILHNLELSQKDESSNTTAAAENLAVTLQAVGKLEEAEELLQRSYEIRLKMLPPTHIQVGVTMFKLASVRIQRADELVAKKTAEAAAAAKVDYKRAEELLRKAIRIAERSRKPVSGAKGSLAMRAGPLNLLLRSLDALGYLEMKKLELATTAKEQERGRREAEAQFRYCLLVLDKPGVSQDLTSIPEFRRRHVACLRHLATLLGSSPKSEAESTRTQEANELLKKAEHIEAELRKSTLKVHL